MIHNNINPTLYVLGFAFNEDNTKVLLIEKNRPNWQVGKLNGVGGHMEKNESAREAMIREFEEESNLRNENWTQYCAMEGDGFVVYVFASYHNDNLSDFVNMTDEKLSIIEVKELHANSSIKTISNIPWLVNMALDYDVMIQNVEPVMIYYD